MKGRDTSIPAVRQRCRDLLAQPPLELTAKGGGLPDPHTVSFDGGFLIERMLLEEVVAILNTEFPTYGGNQ